MTCCTLEAEELKVFLEKVGRAFLAGDRSHSREGALQQQHLGCHLLGH